MSRQGDLSQLLRNCESQIQEAQGKRNEGSRLVNGSLAS